MSETALVWLMLCRNDGQSLRFIRADAPCWKGEINVPLGFVRLTIGWQRRTETQA